MRNISVVCIALSGLEMSIIYRNSLYYGIRTYEASRHLCKEITLGYMNVSIVALGPAYRSQGP